MLGGDMEKIEHEKLSLVTIQLITHQGISNLTTANNLIAVYYHVSLQIPHPNDNTVQRVLKKLRAANTDVSQLLEWKADRCRQTESSTERRSSEQRHWHRKWKATFCGFSHSGQLNIFLVCLILCQNQKLNEMDLNMTHICLIFLSLFFR